MKDKQYDRMLAPELIEGEVGLIVRYTPGKSEAIKIFSGVMAFIDALDKLDKSLLSGVDSALEPVSILNDVKHSSLKILLSRALRNVPDEVIGNPEWRKIIGYILVKGKHLILNIIDKPEKIPETLKALKNDYSAIPGQLINYTPPDDQEIFYAINNIRKARATISDCHVIFQTEYGDTQIPNLPFNEELKEYRDEMISSLVGDHVQLFIQSADFNEKRQWRFFDGDVSFFASIQDESFQQRINSGEKFAKGDYLIVKLRVEQWNVGGKITIKRIVESVLKHESGNRYIQNDLF